MLAAAFRRCYSFSVVPEPPVHLLWFAKTPADREINNMAAAIPPPFCYKPSPCFASSRSASECWSASLVGGQVSFLRISLCVNNLSR